MCVCVCVCVCVCGSNSLKCQASFKKQKSIYIFFAEAGNFSRGN